MAMIMPAGASQEEEGNEEEDMDKAQGDTTSTVDEGDDQDGNGDANEVGAVGNSHKDDREGALLDDTD